MASTATRKRGITIFPAAEAPHVQDTDMLQVAKEQWSVLAHGMDAGETRVLVPDAGGTSLVHVWFKANFPLPRHSHSGDCLYYIISGSAVMGSRTLRAGDSFFVPSDAPYQYTAGPEGVEVLEIRHRVDHIDFTFHDADSYGEKVGKAIEANRESWVTTTVSPTFAANAT